ncbi:putative Lysophosphatidylcholine acyltransferase 1 [Hypsibius exemplaris]|uniref:Lysophosphatidylcholine acyltransferase 1 n=1 Tax=Hypsibius exemplaris TaxID=2072580 RepID=A0A1W0WDA9_HYPEX|nr:putative Lysophosphatidylcholine acyltransferase 1 [Hypsibius exemplaris]
MPQQSPVTQRHGSSFATGTMGEGGDLEESTINNGGVASSSRTPQDKVTPFSYYFKPTLQDYVLMGLMVPLFPFRLLLAVICLLVAWAAGKIALMGLSPEIVNAAPFTGWRLFCRHLIMWCSRALFFAASIQKIEFVGEAADSVGRFEDSSVAPIMISAPHFSYLDAFISGTVDITPVIKASAGKAPVFGRFLTALQPIFVNREKAESRQSTKEAIIRRCDTEKGVWPPVLIFPEGTTGNGKCLFKFKPGAFYPGQPIQLTSIEYISWMSAWNPIVMAWDSCIPVWQSMIYIFLQPHVTARIHILPVYYPTDEENKNPALFASNVQQVLADYLGIPATEHTYENARDYLRSLIQRKRKRS